MSDTICIAPTAEEVTSAPIAVDEDPAADGASAPQTPVKESAPDAAKTEEADNDVAIEETKEVVVAETNGEAKSEEDEPMITIPANEEEEKNGGEHANGEKDAEGPMGKRKLDDSASAGGDSPPLTVTAGEEADGQIPSKMAKLMENEKAKEADNKEDVVEEVSSSG